MAKEYIEREALMKYPIRINHYDKEHGKLDFVLGIESVLEYAEYLPAADVVEVVRCKNCELFRPIGNGKAGNCKWKMKGVVKPYDFCSYGERRTDDG